MASAPEPSPARVIGRYALHSEIASGGMGTVHLGRLVGEVGFSRPVAIKRLHPHLAQKAEFVRMLIDEARLAGRVRHPNVVPTLDVVAAEDELFVVMEYVHGAPLSLLMGASQKAARPVPVRIISSIASGLMQGLHAAHEAKDEHGVPLGIVHRDVSPQNVMVGADGVSRVLDFGVLKARGRLQESTGNATLKGKLGYMAPEQVRGHEVDRHTDVYAASVVLWEMLAMRRLFSGPSEANVLEQILVGYVDPPSRYQPSVPPELDALVLRGLDSNPQKRFRSAREMAIAIERCVPPAPAMEVGEWVERTAYDLLEERRHHLAEIEHAVGPPSDPDSVSLPVARRSSVTSDAGLPSVDTQPELRVRPDELSSISVARRSTQGARRKPGRGLILALLLFTALGGAVFAIWFGREWRSRASTASSPSSASTPSPSSPPSAGASSDPTPGLPSVTGDPPPILDLTPTAEVTATAGAHGPAHPFVPTGTKKPAGASSSAAVAPSTTSAGAPGDDCIPPYTWDSLGRRIYKRHCLKP